MESLYHCVNLGRGICKKHTNVLLHVKPHESVATYWFWWQSRYSIKLITSKFCCELGSNWIIQSVLISDTKIGSRVSLGIGFSWVYWGSLLCSLVYMRKTARFKSGVDFWLDKSHSWGPDWCCGLFLLRVSEVWRLHVPDLGRWVNSFSGRNFKPRLIDRS